MRATPREEGARQPEGEESESVAAGEKSLSVEMAGTEEEAVECLEAELEMDIKKEGEREDEGKE